MIVDYYVLLAWNNLSILEENDSYNVHLEAVTMNVLP